MKQRKTNIFEHHGNRHGFTLIEIVITMQIVVTILFVSTFVFQKTIQYVEEGLFIETFQMTARATQQTAIARHKHVKMVWDEDAQCYQLPCAPYSETLLSVPSFMEVQKAHDLDYSAKGNCPLYATDFASDRYFYHFQWQMGSGKYTYEKKKRETKKRDVFE